MSERTITVQTWEEPDNQPRTIMVQTWEEPDNQPRTIMVTVTKPDGQKREAGLRRRLRRQGYLLRKDRARSLNLDHFGGYMIIDADRNWLVLGPRFDATLDDIEDWLGPDIEDCAAGRQSLPP